MFTKGKIFDKCLGYRPSPILGKFGFPIVLRRQDSEQFQKTRGDILPVAFFKFPIRKKKKVFFKENKKNIFRFAEKRGRNKSDDNPRSSVHRSLGLYTVRGGGSFWCIWGKSQKGFGIFLFRILSFLLYNIFWLFLVSICLSWGRYFG